MQIIELINNKKKFFSVEVSPPSKNKNINTIFKTIERFLPYQPAYVSITHHPLKITPILIEVENKNLASDVNDILHFTDFIDEDGKIVTELGTNKEVKETTKQSSKKRFYQKKHVNQLGLCAAIKYRYNVNVVPHFVCAGMNKVQIEEALLDFSFLEMENILALRGDPATANEKFKPIDGGFMYAFELVEKINAMKQAIFLNKKDGYKSIKLCVGVAGYPECHKSSSNIHEDILNLKQKVDAGADYIVTQMCFDVDVLKNWLKLIREAGINVPVIPGIKPLTSIGQLIKLKYKYEINIPQELENLITSEPDADIAYQKGIEHCINLSNELLNEGFAGIHYFTMGNGKDIEDVVKRVYKI